MITVTLSLDTNAYAIGDVLAATQEVTGYVAVAGSKSFLQSVTVLDADDQKIAMDLVFLSADVALGTENAAPNISDANADNILGIVRIAASDYIDLGGVACATRTGLGLSILAPQGLYIAAITGGAPTHSAAGVKVRLGFVRAL
jgi:hypothetical protein